MEGICKEFLHQLSSPTYSILGLFPTQLCLWAPFPPAQACQGPAFASAPSLALHEEHLL